MTMSQGFRLQRPDLRAWYWLTIVALMLGLTVCGLPLGGSPALVAQEEAKDAAEEPTTDAATQTKTDEVAEKQQESYLVWLYKASGPFGMCIGLESFVLVAL